MKKTPFDAEIIINTQNFSYVFKLKHLAEVKCITENLHAKQSEDFRR